MTIRLAAAAAIGVWLTALPLQADEHTSTIQSLHAVQDGATLDVGGAAQIVDAHDAVVGTDAGDDAAYDDVGGELTAAGIDYDEASSTGVFTLRVADPGPSFTLPETVHYHWYLAVHDGPALQRFQLQALRSSQYVGASPGPDPVFRVVRCSNAATSSCFTTVAHVTGTMADGTVQWRVPADVLGLRPGVTVDGFYSSDVVVQFGASGTAFLGGSFSIDTMDTSAYVVGPVVQLAVTKPSASAETAQFDTRAVLSADGSFTGNVDAARMRTGDYLVWARACHGLAASCGVANQAVFYDEFPDIP